jgi:RNA polymerase sigma-B factor
MATSATGTGSLTGRYATAELVDLDAAALEAYETMASGSSRDADDVRDRLVRLALPFAGRLARRYHGRGEPLDDLVQVARLGLVKAVNRFNPERGSFTAYAVITINGEIKRHFRDRTWGVHVPRRLRDLSGDLARAREELGARTHRQPTDQELATYLALPISDVRAVLASTASYRPSSINARLGEHGGALEELLGSSDGALDAVEYRITLDSLLGRLPERERQIVSMRFYGNLSQVEIGKVFGISQMHVSRLLSQAMTWLRAALLSDAPI